MNLTIRAAPEKKIVPAKRFAEVCALSPKNFGSRSGRDAAPEKREILETPIPLVCEYLSEQLQSQQTEAGKECK